MTPAAPLLVFSVGNPSRGDDALGPRFAERVEALLAPEVTAGEVEFLTDFQLQIEHALDLQGRRRVVFVDASVRAAAPFTFTETAARRDASHSSHAMSPEAVLETFRAVYGPPPPAHVLALRGLRFELGEDLTDDARAHLDAAVDFFVRHVRSRGVERMGCRYAVEGTVQGVGFRPWVHRTARALGLAGRVFNDAGGVVIEAFGTSDAHDALRRALGEGAPSAARVTSVRTAALALRDARGFVIDASEREGAGRVTIPADLAVCEACMRDVDDPRDRHHGYAFTSCALCGPRFSVVEALPYDRANTTMAPFALCAACAGEYADPDDRRFHAQSVACARCGPRWWLADPRGAVINVPDPVAALAERLCAGQIVGWQGFGAFHLACDATDGAAVAELRRRKRRDAKPFAVMVRDLDQAEAIAALDDVLRERLRSPARPIVLADAREGALPAGVCGPSRQVGLMLPYTALHHRVLRQVARPLVMTSGNRSGEPAVIAHGEAFAALGPMVDAFALHDRAIVRRVEDSVVAVIAGAPRVLRRARGYAPEPIALGVSSPEPVLAVGGHLKNTVCVVVDDRAYLSPHLGDLESVEAEAAWRADLAAFVALVGVSPAVVAHDLHPDYATTRFALESSARVRVGVQHHVAHVLAAVAEHRIDAPVVGVALDGTGHGLDGTLWGAEVLLVDGPRWERAGSFRPLPLAGGERAVRETWRAAFGALCDAFGAEAAQAMAPGLAVFREVPAGALGTLAAMMAAGVNTPRARGMGRWFDAVGALALGTPRAGFEGHVALALEARCGALAGVGAYPYDLAAGDGFTEIDLRPTVRAVVADLAAGVGPEGVSVRWHTTVVAATATLVERALEASGARRVVLSGGCLQNRVLARGLVEAIGRDRVVMGSEVPVSDGGLALGQAWAAVLTLVRGDAQKG